MLFRVLRGIVVSGAVLTASAACGAGGGLRSDSFDQVVDAWSDVVCEDEPAAIDALPRSRDADRTLECHSKDASQDAGDGSIARLSLYRDASLARASAADEEDDCDVPYAVVRGPHWVSRTDDHRGTDGLVDAGGTLVCEGS